MSPKKKTTTYKKRTGKPRTTSAIKKPVQSPINEPVLADESYQETLPHELTADNYLLSWQAPEFTYHEKPVWWHASVYSGLGILSIVMAFLGQWFAVVVFILLGIVVYRYAEIKPKIVDIILTDIGIIIGGKIYPYNTIRSFWIIYQPPVKTLNIELTQRISQTITIQLEDTNPALARDILREHILEEPRTEDIFEKVVRFMRF